MLRQRLSELQRDAASASGTAKTGSAAKSKESAKLKDANREVKKLARENRQLKNDIEKLKAVQLAAEKSVAEAGDKEEQSQSIMLRGPVSEEARSWTPWQWLLFGSILLLTFAAGGYVVDWDSRRRHGGFRI